MKGTSLFVSIILFIAVAILYVLYFTGSNTGTESTAMSASQTENTGSLKIAFVKADSIVVNYELSKILNEEFLKMQEAYNTEYATQRQSFEDDATAFQEKLQNGGFLTEARAVQERDRLLGREQEIMQLDQDLSTKLANLQDANSQQVLDSLMNCVEMLNAGKEYDYIFSASGLLVGDEAHNLTREVLELLNERYLETN